MMYKLEQNSYSKLTSNLPNIFPQFKHCIIIFMMASSNVLLILFIILYFYSVSSTNSSCIETEWKALMDFKGSLADEGNQLSSWTGRDCCSWYGITCHNRTGFVRMINLSDSQDVYSPRLLPTLGGHINSSLLHLEHLEYLDLSNNNFSGIPIPAFLGSLKNLMYLDLQRANFSGEIPQQLGNLSNLHHLSLGDDEYYFISSTSLSSKRLGWITGLSSLRGLELYGINLTECFDWLDSINMLSSSLSSLTLRRSGLIAMAQSHELNLTSLVSVDLSGNNFHTAFPLSFFNLSSLEHIDISENDLQGPIPNMFHKLTSLNSLDLALSSFSSSIPDSLCTLNALTALNLHESMLKGSIPFCIGNLTSLTSLNLGVNDLSGTIPSELGSLTNLTFLGLEYNQLSGELSESFFEGRKSLEYLGISENHHIVFNVSPQWIPPFQLEFLYMDSVFIGLKPPFPSWLQTQTDLIELSLRNTSISGVFPHWCQTSFPQLYYFDLSKNFLTGPIPTFKVINKATIIDLSLSDNQLTGNIPDALCNLHSMQTLGLANNQLIGRIPSCLGSLKDLNTLDLANNRLSDHIPSELGCLYNLAFLRLDGNKLFGELPSSLQNLTQLRTLDLGKNELEGFIPSWIGKELTLLEHLMLQSNKFYGEIPVNLCQLPFLQILNLPGNSLVGTIPPCLGNLSMMQSNDSGTYWFSMLLTINFKGIELEYSSNLVYAKFISLSGNHLHGKIPDELMELKGLHSLNLSNNELTGEIPEMIGNMKRLESLDLSRNQLSGTIPQSLADIDDLEYLKLSFNNLSGRIPSGGHFDTFDDPSVYEGNDELCGKPVARSCGDDTVPSKHNGSVSDEDDEFEIEWIYAGIGPGFAVGFLGVFFLLYFKSSWRYALFRFLENVYNKL